MRLGRVCVAFSAIVVFNAIVPAILAIFYHHRMRIHTETSFEVRRLRFTVLNAFKQCI